MERAVGLKMDVPRVDPMELNCAAIDQIAAIGEAQKTELISVLCKRIERLETERNINSQVYQAFRDLENRYHALIENIPDVVFSLDEWGNFMTVNNASSFIGYAPDELIGTPFVDIVYPDDQHYAVGTYFEAVADRKNVAKSIQFRILSKDGEAKWIEANCATLFTEQGEFIIHEGVARDITNSINKQQILLKEQEALEAQILSRTKELMQINAELQRQITERAAAERALLEREEALELEKANLKEANTALKVLLKRREMDKQALEEQVLHNIKKLVVPYLNKMQKEIADEKHKIYLSIVESNLIDITCGFSRRLSFEFYGLSTSELKVANFIRQGKKTREIAEVLGLSVRTVEAFRQSIRQKLRLQNKKVNLRTFLMSIT